MTTEDIVFWSALSGPLLYLGAIFFTPAPTSSSDYHYATRTLPPHDYVDTTVMYAVQVAAVALFATWGYLYGLVTTLVPIFWGLGYVIVARMISNGKLDNLLTTDSFGTLHQFISYSGKFPAVAMLAAILTLLAIAGPAMFEAFFTASVIERSLPNTYKGAGFNIALLFLLFSAIYMIRGGFRGGVRLDRIQLATGYLGFVLFLSVLIFSAIGKGNGPVLSIISLILMICTSAIAYGRHIHSKRTNHIDFFALITTCTAVVISATLCILLLINASPITEYAIIKQFFFPDSFSLLAIFSLFVANGIYQLVDVGQWQRLLSVNPNHGSIENSRLIIAQSIYNIAYTSPLTWVISIMLGILLRVVSPDANAYEATLLIVDYLVSLPTWYGPILLSLLIVSLSAIMFSTIDALVSATSFTVCRDVIRIKNTNKSSLYKDRFVTVLTLLAQLVFFLVVREFSDDKADAVLYLCWSFQIGFAPAVIFAIYKVELPQLALLLSLAAGVVGAVVPLLFIGSESVYEYSPWLALVFAAFFVSPWMLRVSRIMMGRELS